LTDEEVAKPKKRTDPIFKDAAVPWKAHQLSAVPLGRSKVLMLAD
jgi:hypothetical protein